MTPKPATVPLVMDGVPAVLRAQPWIGFRLVYKPADDEWKKGPFQIGHPRDYASNANAEHWRNEGDVREVQIMAPDLFDGFGIVLTPDANITLVDLDHVRDPDTGVIEDWALQMVEAFDTWTEISVSGTGLHIFPLGRLPGSGFNSYLDGDPTRRVEAYSIGRFAYLTGCPLEPVRPVAERQRLITLLAEHVRPAGPVGGPAGAPIRDDAPILRGQQNDALFRIARSFVLHGLRGPALDAALLAVAQRRCIPVPPDADVVKIARHAERLPDRRPA